MQKQRISVARQQNNALNIGSSETNCLPQATQQPHHTFTRAYDPHHASLDRHAVLIVIVIVVLEGSGSSRAWLDLLAAPCTRLASLNSQHDHEASACIDAFVHLLGLISHHSQHTHSYRTWPHSPAFSCGDERWAHPPPNSASTRQTEAVSRQASSSWVPRPVVSTLRVQSVLQPCLRVGPSLLPVIVYAASPRQAPTKS